MQTLEQRIRSRLVEDENGCWRWSGTPRSDGYVRTTMKGLVEGYEYIHRMSYMIFHGPIPEGMHIDHLCMVRDCANPAHLEAVSPGVNNQRMVAAMKARGPHPLKGVPKGPVGNGRLGWRAAFCKRGHERNEANTSEFRSSVSGKIYRRCDICIGIKRREKRFSRQLD